MKYVFAGVRNISALNATPFLAFFIKIDFCHGNSNSKYVLFEKLGIRSLSSFESLRFLDVLVRLSSVLGPVIENKEKRLAKNHTINFRSYVNCQCLCEMTASIA